MPDERFFQKLKGTLNPDEYANIVNYFNGVRIKIKTHQITIVKSSDSKCSNDFIFTLDDVTQGGQRNIMTERFNLSGGDYKIIRLAEPDSDHCDIKTVRTINLKYSVNSEDMLYHKVIMEKYPFLKDWNVVGPFDYNPEINIKDVSYPPEKEMSINLTNTYMGKGNRVVRWQSIACDKDGLVDLGSVFNETNAVAYGLTYIYSGTEQSVKFFMNSDDGIELWLNHQKLHSHHVFRGVNHKPDEASGTLKKGINEVLVKISQQGGGWSFLTKIDHSQPIKISRNPDKF
jgi:hypothetical protein